MRHRIRAAALVALAGLGFATPASAWYFELANDDNDAAVEVYFVPQGSAALQGYTLFFGYDEAKLNWLGPASQTPPAPLQGGLFGTVTRSGSGALDNFNGSAFVGGATLTQRTRIGQLPFQVAGSVLDGQPDVTFAPARKGFLVAVNGVLHEGAAVPVLLGAGLDLPRPPPASGCGIGPELALALPLLLAARRRRRALAAAALVLLALAAAPPAEATEPTGAFAEAVAGLPLLSLDVQPGAEVWIRVRPEHAGEAREVMRDVAALYRAHTPGTGPVTVLLFVGARPIARETY